MEAPVGTVSEHTMLEANDAAAPALEEVRLERGRSVGRYVLLRRLGAGGMGVVWAAWDPELDREVAIKLLHRGSANDKARARLQREAQAMARITHPNIIAVYDVGVVDDRVFVAMEYVRGQTLRAWLRARPRSWREVVAVHRQAALGLAAAHEAGLVHRDFKPDNAMIDDGGRVRVMDFGLAAAHEGNADDVIQDVDGLEGLAVERSTSGGLLSTPLTEVGRLVGTPAFMAPEQLLGKRGGPASDQFALCVAAWQSLTGARPYPGDDLETLVLAMRGGKLRAPPASRRIPAAVRKILERGLSFTAEQRWPSMTALANALEAAERGASRTWLLAGGVTLAALVAATIGAGLWSQRARVDRCEHAAADDGWDPAEHDRVAAAMTEAGPHGAAVWARAAPMLDGWVETRRGVVAQACLEEDGLPAALRVTQAVCLDRQQRALAETLTLLRSADAEIAARAIDMIAALPEPARCADAEVLVALDRRPPPQEPQTAAIVRDAITHGQALLRAGRHVDAEAGLAALRTTANELADPALEGELLAALAEAELGQGRHQDAAATATAAYAALLRAGEDQAAAAVAIDLISAHADLAQGELARGWDLHASALLDRVDAKPSLRAARLGALATLADSEGDYALALRLLEEAGAMQIAAHGEDSREHARLLRRIAAVHGRLGALTQAKTAATRSLELLAAELGPAHPEVGNAHLELGNVAYRGGDLDEARRHYEQAIQIVEPVLGSEHGIVTGAHTGLGVVALGFGESPQAADHFQAALDGVEQRVGEAHPDLVPPLVNLGIAHKRAGDLAAAEASQRRAVALLEQLYGPDHPHLLAALDNLGEVQALAGDHRGAADSYRRSLAIGEARFGVDHPELDYALVGLGDAALALADLEQARRAFARVLTHTDAEGKQQDLVAVAHFGLARVLDAEGEPAAARERAEEARALLVALPRPDAGERARIDAWLLAHP